MSLPSKTLLCIHLSGMVSSLRQQGTLRFIVVGFSPAGRKTDNRMDVRPMPYVLRFYALRITHYALHITHHGCTPDALRFTFLRITFYVLRFTHYIPVNRRI